MSDYEYRLTPPPEPKNRDARDRVTAIKDHTVAKLRAIKHDATAGIRRTFSEPMSALVRDGIANGLERSRNAPQTPMQRLAATLDANSQGNLADGWHVTPRMLEHMRTVGHEPVRSRAEAIAAVGGAPIPPGARDALAPAATVDDEPEFFD